LVVHAASADVIATLIALKHDYEEFSGNKIRLTIVGGEEAHLLAAELAQANVSVVLTSPRPFPGDWEERRMSVNLRCHFYHF
jgi:hypothetical protein